MGDRVGWSRNGLVGGAPIESFDVHTSKKKQELVSILEYSS